jgi:hypothetical protein
MTRIGLECKLYYNNTADTATNGAGTYASPVWVELTNVKDVTVAMSKGEADTSRRGNSWRSRKGTLKDASIDFNLVQEDGDTGFDVLLDSFMNGTALDLLAINGEYDEVGAQGLRATCEIFKNDDGQGLEEAEMYDFSAKPTPANDDGGDPILPVWFCPVEGS